MIILMADQAHLLTDLYKTHNCAFVLPPIIFDTYFVSSDVKRDLLSVYSKNILIYINSNVDMSYRRIFVYIFSSLAYVPLFLLEQQNRLS